MNSPERETPFTVRSAHLVVPLLVAFCLLKLVFLAFFAVNATYVMDEFAQAGYSRHIEDGFYENLDPVKTVLWVYVYHLARVLADDSNQLMAIARLEGLAMSLLVVVLCAACARRLGRERAAILFTVAVLLSFTNYIERSFRIRADTVAVVFAVAALWVLLSWGRRSLGIAAVGLLSAGAFLTTQKAVYVVIALGLAVLAFGGTLSERIRRVAIYGAAAGAALLLYAVAFGGTDFLRVLEMVFTSPLSVALDADDFYSDLAVYVWQTLGRNWFAYALCAGGALVAAARFRRGADELRAALVFTVVITTFVFMHNQPWPYVFVMALPFLSLWAPEIPGLLARRAQWQEASALLLALAVLALGFGRNLAYLDHVNTAQRFVVRQAESLLAPEDRYQDGLGMVPMRREAVESWWDAMNATLFLRAVRAGDRGEIHRILENHPKLWIVNYRVLNLMPVLEPYLRRSYVLVSPNIFLAGAIVRSGGETTFANHWPGAYELYAPDGKPAAIPFEIDGRAVAGPTMIPVGSHRIRTGAPGAYALLPAGLRVPPRDEMGPPIDLFPRVYD